MKVRGNKWQVFPEKNFLGNPSTLITGDYATLESMDLSTPVMSMRPNPAL